MKLTTNINPFSLGLLFVLEHEGDYVNDPDDPGGETKFGISKKSYPDLDIKALTRLEAMDIYRKDYWNALGCDSMTTSVAICAFDSAVNCGVGRVKQWLADLNVKDVEVEKRVSRELLHRRLAYYNLIIEKNPILQKFSRGWGKRVNDLSKYIDL